MAVRVRPIGKTGLVTSELSLGTWGISGDGYGPVDKAEAERVIARALDIGITLFETADAYGAGEMEATLGRVLGSSAAGKAAIVVTKGGVDRTTEPPRKRFDAAYIRESVERSIKRLGREKLELYLLHNPSADAVILGEATDALMAMKKDGLIAHWGVSVGDTDTARAAIEKGAEVIELAYNVINALDMHRLAGDIMVSGVGVLARSTLAYGLLTGMWAKDREFSEGDHRVDRWTKLELERRIEQLDAVRFLVKGDILTMRGAAVRFALANHLVSTAVLGPKSVTQLEQLVRETGAGPRYIPDEDLAALHRALQKVGIAT